MSTPSGRSLGPRIVALFAPYRGRLALVLAVIVISSGLSVVGALLVKVVFDKALFPPGGPDLPLLFELVAALRVLAWGAVAMAITSGIGALVGLAQFAAGRRDHGIAWLPRRPVWSAA